MIFSMNMNNLYQNELDDDNERDRIRLLEKNTVIANCVYH